MHAKHWESQETKLYVAGLIVCTKISFGKLSNKSQVPLVPYKRMRQSRHVEIYMFYFKMTLLCTGGLKHVRQSTRHAHNARRAVEETGLLGAASCTVQLLFEKDSVYSIALCAQLVVAGQFQSSAHCRPAPNLPAEK